MNRVTLQATKFTNFPQGDETLGWRMYDDYGQVYDNTLETIPEDDLELLQLAIKSDSDEMMDMLSIIQEQESGIYIGDTWYNWCEIKHLWSEL